LEGGREGERRKRLCLISDQLVPLSFSLSSNIRMQTEGGREGGREGKAAWPLCVMLEAEKSSRKRRDVARRDNDDDDDDDQSGGGETEPKTLYIANESEKECLGEGGREGGRAEGKKGRLREQKEGRGGMRRSEV